MATATADQNLTPGQVRRASNVVLGLIFKGMNDFCQREVTAFNSCRSFYTAHHKSGQLEGGECGREREFMGTCRLLVSDSITTQCQSELFALTHAIGKKEGEEVVQGLTDRLYRCGMTPVPGLDDGKATRFPGRLEEAIVEVAEERQKRAEFVKVVQRQLTEQQEAKRTYKKAE